MLLYLVKHLCPNLANVTRELSKAYDGANSAAYTWEIICFSDSDYMGDPMSRQRISGFI